MKLEERRSVMAERRKQIFDLHRYGFSKPEIASMLGISQQTVHNHLASITSTKLFIMRKMYG